mmetsp:Transcript_16222/g.33622  ORF Transcript_16222/g.33622 Transcript_16222/m.33622 type:complete len:289 (-) Transcript_16222:1815-2681(-)
MTKHLPSRIDNCIRQRMFAPRFCTTRQPQRNIRRFYSRRYSFQNTPNLASVFIQPLFLLFGIVTSPTITSQTILPQNPRSIFDSTPHHRPPGGKRPRLIKHHRLDVMRHFQDRPSLDEQTRYRSHSGSDHDRRGRGETQGTRTCNHHHADRRHERRHVHFLLGSGHVPVAIAIAIVIAGVTQRQNPTQKRQNRQPQNARSENRSDPIGLRLNRCPIPLGFVDQSHYAREDRFGSRGGDADEDDGELIDARSVEGVAGAFGDGEGFSGEGGFVYIGASGVDAVVVWFFG